VRIVLIVLTLLWPASIFAQNADGYLKPYQPNAYGPGINSDAAGRPFRWEPLPGNGPADPLSGVSPDMYGPGIGMDQYGRPVQPAPLSRDVPQEGSPDDNFGAIAFSSSRGAVGYSYDYHSGNEAQQSALQSCGTDCKIVVRFANACGALAVGTDGSYGTGWAGNRQDAESTAMRYCNSSTTGCGIARWVCTSR